MLLIIFYRTGGTLNGKWNRVFGQFTAEQAASKCAELARMGYPTRTQPVEG